MKSTLWSLLSNPYSIKRPGLNFSHKVSIKRLDLSKVLRASVHENQGNLDFFEKLFIKPSVLSQFQILDALND